MALPVVARTAVITCNQNYLRENTEKQEIVLLLLRSLEPGRALRQFDASTQVTQLHLFAVFSPEEEGARLYSRFAPRFCSSWPGSTKTPLP